MKPPVAGQFRVEGGNQYVILPGSHNGIIRQLSRIKQKERMFREYGDKNLCVAVLSELSNATPTNIRLLSLNLDLSKISKDKNSDGKHFIVLDGIILKNHQGFDTSLAWYLLRLKNLPLFGSSKIIRKSFESFGEKEVLRFKAHLDVVGILI